MLNIRFMNESTTFMDSQPPKWSRIEPALSPLQQHLPSMESANLFYLFSLQQIGSRVYTSVHCYPQLPI